MDVVFIIDIVLSFNTAYVKTGECILVVDRKEIARNYLKLWFPIDVAGSLPMDLILFIIDVAQGNVNIGGGGDGGGGGAVALVKILKIPKMMRLGRLFRFLSRFEGARLFHTSRPSSLAHLTPLALPSLLSPISRSATLPTRYGITAQRARASRIAPYPPPHPPPTLSPISCQARRTSVVFSCSCLSISYSFIGCPPSGTSSRGGRGNGSTDCARRTAATATSPTGKSIGCNITCSPSAHAWPVRTPAPPRTAHARQKKACLLIASLRMRMWV